MYQMQSEANFKKNKGLVVESFEEEPIKVDIKVEGLNKISGVPIEGLGVYSFSTNIVSKQQGKDQKNPKSIGVICNIKQEGFHKKIYVES
jgi:hypothetical protein